LQLPDHENNETGFLKKEDTGLRRSAEGNRPRYRVRIKKAKTDENKKSSLTHEQATKEPRVSGVFFRPSDAGALTAGVFA
jgi:hypothetical protein